MRTAPVGLLAAATITAGGSDIYLRVTSSPVDLEIWWYRCDDDRVCGRPVAFPAGDHSRKLIGSNFRAGTKFCLGVACAAELPPWHGIVDWNVYS